jgi:Domain of unknown function (DUF1707)
MAEGDMRAADTDRQTVAERLRAALDEGRLDLHEYDDRLQQAYAAKTYGELERLTTDLPNRQALVRPSASERDSSVTRRWLIHTWDEWVTAVGICVAIWLTTVIASQDLFYFWPVWVAGPWGVVLIWQTVTGLSQGEPQKWQAKQDRKKAAKERKKLEE